MPGFLLRSPILLWSLTGRDVSAGALPSGPRRRRSLGRLSRLTLLSLAAFAGAGLVPEYLLVADISAAWLTGRSAVRVVPGGLDACLASGCLSSPTLLRRLSGNP